MPTGLAQTTTYTGTAGSISDAVRGTSIMIWTTTDAFVCIGATATTANGTPIPAFTPIWLPIPDSINQGETPTVLVSAIQISAGGSFFARQFA